MSKISRGGEKNYGKISPFELFCNIKIDEEEDNEIYVQQSDEKREDLIRLQDINNIKETQGKDIYKIEHSNRNNIENDTNTQYNKYICGEQFNKNKNMYYIDCMNDAMKYVDKENNKVNMDQHMNNRKNEKFDKNRDLHNGDMYINTFNEHDNSTTSGYERMSTYF